VGVFSFVLGMLHGLVIEEFVIERKRLWKRIMLTLAAGSLMYLIFFAAYHEYFSLKLIELVK